MEFWKQLFSFGIALLVIGVGFGGFHPLSTSLPPISPSTATTCIGALFLVGLSFWRLRFVPKLEPKAFSLALFLILISDIPSRAHTIFEGTHPHPFILVAALVGTILFLLFGTRLFPITLVVTVISAWVAFHLHAEGRLLFSDDHGPFLYRLALLRDNFPQIPFYNPLWNGGIDAREFFPSGIINLFILFSPIIYLFPIELIYNVLVLSVAFIVLPLSVLSAIRILKGDWTTAYIGAAISVLPSLYWFRWVLSYGAMGFVTSVSLFPIFFALVIKFIGEEKWNKRDALIFTLIGVLTLLWPLCGLMLAPFGIVALIKISRIVRVPSKVISLLLICAIMLPWAAIFLKASPVTSFLKRDTHLVGSMEVQKLAKDIRADSRYKARPKNPSLKISLSTIRDHMRHAHPLLIFAVPGILILESSALYLLGSLWLLAIGILGGPMLPHLELDRFIVVLSVLLTVPAAFGARRIIEMGTKVGNVFYIAPLLAALLITPFSLSTILAGRTTEVPYFANDTVWKLSDLIKEYSRGGRTIFTGFTLHELSNGHVAPLAYFANSPLIAKSYQHDTWRYQEVVPLEYRSQGESGIEEYFDLMNVTLVIADEDQWEKWLDDRPKRYKELWRDGGFRLYNRDVPSSYLLKGEGELVSQNTNSLTLRVQSEEVIVKTRYFPFLRASLCEISGVPQKGDLVLIQLSNCPKNSLVTISSISPLERVLK